MSGTVMVEGAVKPAAESVFASRPRLRLWIPTLALIAYWIVAEGGRRIELAMFDRFISRFIAWLALMLIFAVWGFTRRRFTWTERLVGFGAIVLLMVLAGLVSDPTVGVFGMALMGLPIALTLATIWLWLISLLAPASPVPLQQTSATDGPTPSPRLLLWNRPAVELAGVVLSSLVVFGTIALLRWDGLYGGQRSQMSWRWTPTAEQQFLSDHQSRSGLVADPANVVPATVSETDWASFRGGDRESTVAGVTPGDWSRSAPRELWKKRVGPGWSSVIAVGDVLITQEQRSDHEAVVCYRANDGAEVWAYLSDDRFEETLSGTGPRATPSAVGDRVVAYGARGRLECLELTTGKPVWSHQVLDETGGAVPMWGLSVSPLIVDDLVVVFAGGKNEAGLVAYHLTTGEKAWQSPSGTMTYCSPQVLTLAGVRQIVMQDEQGLSGYEIAEGRRLWTHPSPHAASFQPMIQPHLVGDDRLVVGWGPGTLCLQLGRDTTAAWSLTELWNSNRLKPGFNDVIVHDGHIYGLDDGILCCIDAASGKRIWKDGRYGFGQLLFLAETNELLILSEQGEVIRVAASPDGLNEHGRFKAIDGKTWNHPIIAQGRLIVRNAEEMACFALEPATDIATAKR